MAIDATPAAAVTALGDGLRAAGHGDAPATTERRERLEPELAMIARQLARRPRNWDWVVRALPRRLRSFHVSALQARLFNQVLARRQPGRGELLEACTTEDVSVNDPYACFAGRDELVGHITNTLVHMPGVVMRRDGDVLQCQGAILFEWAAKGPDGLRIAEGKNVARLAPDGRIAAVRGFVG